MKFFRFLYAIIFLLVCTNQAFGWERSINNTKIGQRQPRAGTFTTLKASTIEIPNSNSLPATCVIGEIYMDTDATSGQRCYLCESANSWVLQGDGGGGAVGSVTTIEEGDAQVGGADIIVLDFLANDFIIGETPDTEINISIDYTNGQAAATGIKGFLTGTDWDTFNGKQPLEATLTDIADGTINENLVNTANPWADNEVSNDLTLDLLKMAVLTSAPASPVAGRIYCADNSTWDPSDVAGTDNYYCIYDGSDYIAVMDEDGAIFVSSIEMPSYTHWATGDATYNDTSTPHVLTSEEMKGGLISNAGASQDRVYTFGAAEFGINGVGMVIAAFQMDFEPHSGEAFWLNGTQMAANEHIQNTADTKGDVIAFWSVESGDGTYEIFFKSDNANWVEATP